MKFLHVHRFVTGTMTHSHDREVRGAQWIVSINVSGEDRVDFHVHPDLADLENFLALEERKEMKAK